MNTDLSPQCILSRNQSIFASRIDGELVMMDEKQSAYFGLNPVGSTIWDNLNEPLSVEALIDRLVTHYSVDRERCRQEIQPFLRQMLEHGLVNEVKI